MRFRSFLGLSLFLWVIALLTFAFGVRSGLAQDAPAAPVPASQTGSGVAGAPAPVPTPVTAQTPAAPAARREETETAVVAGPAAEVPGAPVPMANFGQRFRSFLLGAPLPQVPAPEAAARIASLESQVSTLTAERDQLRGMIAEAESAMAEARTLREQAQAAHQQAERERAEVAHTAQVQAMEIASRAGIPAAELPKSPAGAPAEAPKPKLEGREAAASFWGNRFAKAKPAQN